MQLTRLPMSCAGRRPSWRRRTAGVAIENKLGLKYFNGCAEDHVGIRSTVFKGLRYGDGSPRNISAAPSLPVASATRIA